MPKTASQVIFFNSFRLFFITVFSYFLKTKKLGCVKTVK